MKVLQMWLKIFVIVLCVFTIDNREVFSQFSGVDKIVDAENLLTTQGHSDGYYDVIVTLKPAEYSGNTVGPIDVIHPTALQRKVLKKMSESTGRDIVQMAAVPMFSGRFSLTGIQELAAMDEVYAIEENRRLYPSTKQGLQLIGKDESNKGRGGKGVAIAIVDTGINYNHPGLGGPGFPNGKVIGGYDFGDADADPMEEVYLNSDNQKEQSTHGSSCAGIAAGLDTSVGDYIGGVAPEAKLYGLKIVDKNGLMKMQNALAAWDWVIQHQYDDPENPILIISNSFGNPRVKSTGYCNHLSPAMSRMAEEAGKRGIAIYVASGNESMATAISFPACLEDTIAIGAVYDADLADNARRDMVASYSNVSPILDMFAPSHNSYTVSAPGQEYTENFGGTSAACPYAAGAAAVLQSAFKEKFGNFMSVYDLRKMMAVSGQEIIDHRLGVTQYAIKKPRINLAWALKMLDEYPLARQPIKKGIQAGSGMPAESRNPNTEDGKKTGIIIDY